MRGRKPLIVRFFRMENVKRLILTLNTKVRNLSQLWFIFLLFSLLFITAASFKYFISLFQDYDVIFFNLPFEGAPLLLTILFASILGPIVETYLYLVLPYKLLKKSAYFNGHKYLMIIVSAVIFGISHMYSFFYVIYAFLLGVIFMFSYLVRVTSDKNAFWLVALAHSLFNLITSLINYIS
jgi:uncharacterized protein